MAKRKCPGCGGWYDGKKCRSCLYVHFEDIEKHDHYHGIYGEEAPYTKAATPVVNAAPAKAPEQPAEKPASSGSKKNEPRKKLLPLVLLPVILSIVSSVFDFVSEFSDVRPEDLQVPGESAVIGDAHALFAADGFRLMGSWLPGSPIEEDLPLTLVNESDRDLTVSIGSAAVNGMMTKGVFLFATAEAGSSAEATLWIDRDELDALGIKTIETVTLSLRAYDAETYEDLIPETVFSLYTGEAASVLPEYPLNMPLLVEEDFSLYYMGIQEATDGAWDVWFYAENNTNRTLAVSDAYIEADGIALDTFLWQDLLPQSRCFFCCTVEAAGENLLELETELTAMDAFSGDVLYSTGPLELALFP